MNQYVLHPRTREALKQLQASPLHGYVFAGPAGLGKTTLAIHSAAAVMGGAKADQARWTKLVTVPEDKKKIPLSAIAEIIEFLHQKKSEAVNKKVVIIDAAEHLSIEAANALLKILEEPPADSLLILVTDRLSALPATVRSRLAVVEFKTPDAADVESSFSDPAFPSLLQTVGPLPARLANLLADSEKLETFQLLQTQASEFTSAELSTKLQIAGSIAAGGQAAEFLALLAHTTPGSTSAQHLLLSEKHLYNSGNPRFVLEHLALAYS